MKKNKSKWKTILLIVSSIILILTIGVFIIYYVVIPKVVSNIILKETNSSFLPPEVNEQIKYMRENIPEVNAFLSRNNINKNDLIDIISKSQNKNITKFIKDTREKNFTSPNQIIEVASKHFDLSKLDTNKLKNEIDANVTKDDIRLIQDELKSIDLDSKAYILSIPIIKSTIIEILKSKE